MHKEKIRFLDEQAVRFCVTQIGNKLVDHNLQLFARPVVVLNGAIHFYSDLARFIRFEKEPLFVKVNTRDYMGIVKDLDDWWLQVLYPKDDHWSEESNFVIIDEINDSGNTFKFIKDWLIKNTETEKPIDVYDCQLLKREESEGHGKESFSGIVVTNEVWFAGYGMDYENEESRHTNNIYGIL